MGCFSNASSIPFASSSSTATHQTPLESHELTSDEGPTCSTSSSSSANVSPRCLASRRSLAHRSLALDPRSRIAGTSESSSPKIPGTWRLNLVQRRWHRWTSVGRPPPFDAAFSMSPLPDSPKHTRARQTAMSMFLSISRVHRRRSLGRALIGSIARRLPPARSASSSAGLATPGAMRRGSRAFVAPSRFDRFSSLFSAFSLTISAFRFRLASTSSRLIVPSAVSWFTTLIQSCWTKWFSTSTGMVLRAAISRTWSWVRTLVARRNTDRAAAFSASASLFSFSSSLFFAAATRSRISDSLSLILSSSSRRTTLWRMVRSLNRDQVFAEQIPVPFSKLSPFLDSCREGKAPRMSGFATISPRLSFSSEPFIPLNVASNAFQYSSWPARESTRAVHQSPGAASSSSSFGVLVWNLASRARR
mmetsp:Transcript_12390/g.55881  ORF Transcript_12390/g.55881 Transcript_12390/m.55881 type:complete len:419 (-) Transcript_12390:350-1606(-)